MSSPTELFLIVYANNNEFDGRHEDRFWGNGICLCRLELAVIFSGVIWVCTVYCNTAWLLH
jgi:hypothetical protein